MSILTINVHALTLIVTIFGYFNETAKYPLMVVMSNSEFKTRGYYEIMFHADYIDRTLRVYFTEDCVHMVWLEWKHNEFGDYEIETDAWHDLPYAAFHLDRATALAAFDAAVEMSHRSLRRKYRVAFSAFFESVDAFIEMRQ